MSAWSDRAAALSKRAPEGAKVAEIGHGFGKMAGVLAATRPDLKLTVIDNFLAADEQPERYRRTGDNFAKSTRAQAQARMKDAEALCARMGWGLMVADSVQASFLFPPLAFDVVFLDADHSYEGVARDISAWTTKARRWIGGHDYMNPDRRFNFTGVERAVNERFGGEVELDANFTWWVAM